MKTMNLIDKVFNFTQEKQLLPASGTVLLGLSGGADSMALLHVLCHWPNPAVRVTAVHIHHGIRGAEAARDEAFVREQCVARGVPLYVVRADVPAIAAAEHRGLEETGRQVRYAVFDQLRQRLAAHCIATAHTASDQAETVLLHLVRGCGVAGLCGIPARRGAVVRPLLTCTREEIEAYCREQNVPYIQDGTNEDLRYSRNRIRHQVLPLLRQINPAADAALLRLATAAEEDEACLRQLARQRLAEAKLGENDYRTEAFVSQPPAICHRMIRLALTAAGCHSPEQRHITAARRMLSADDGTVSLPGGYRLRVTGKRLTVRAIPRQSGRSTPPLLVERLPLAADFAGKTICLERLTDSPENVHKMFFKYAVDYDKIQGNLSVRCRAPGDRLHPAGRRVGKSLKALMNEQHVPVEQRRTYPLLCDEKGIVLVPGICCDERVRPDEHTKHFLVWRTIDELS